jgi:hypothetical protein
MTYVADRSQWFSPDLAPAMSPPIGENRSTTQNVFGKRRRQRAKSTVISLAAVCRTTCQSESWELFDHPGDLSVPS